MPAISDVFGVPYTSDREVDHKGRFGWIGAGASSLTVCIIIREKKRRQR